MIVWSASLKTNGLAVLFITIEVMKKGRLNWYYTLPWKLSCNCASKVSFQEGRRVWVTCADKHSTIYVCCRCKVLMTLTSLLVIVWWYSIVYSDSPIAFPWTEVYSTQKNFKIFYSKNSFRLKAGWSFNLTAQWPVSHLPRRALMFLSVTNFPSLAGCVSLVKLRTQQQQTTPGHPWSQMEDNDYRKTVTKIKKKDKTLTNK